MITSTAHFKTDHNMKSVTEPISPVHFTTSHPQTSCLFIPSCSLRDFTTDMLGCMFFISLQPKAHIRPFVTPFIHINDNRRIIQITECFVKGYIFSFLHLFNLCQNQLWPLLIALTISIGLVRKGIQMEQSPMVHCSYHV
jgi:hypothetical protein